MEFVQLGPAAIKALTGYVEENVPVRILEIITALASVETIVLVSIDRFILDLAVDSEILGKGSKERAHQLYREQQIWDCLVSLSLLCCAHLPRSVYKRYVYIVCSQTFLGEYHCTHGRVSGPIQAGSTKNHKRR